MPVHQQYDRPIPTRNSGVSMAGSGNSVALKQAAGCRAISLLILAMIAHGTAMMITMQGRACGLTKRLIPSLRWQDGLGCKQQNDDNRTSSLAIGDPCRMRENIVSIVSVAPESKMSHAITFAITIAPAIRHRTRRMPLRSCL